MRRTTPLAAAALVALTALTPATGAAAVGETCRGEAATLVGSPGPLSLLRGTEERDVIVTGGSQDVHGGGGDDLICVDGATELGLALSISVDAGDGDDVVDTTGAGSSFVTVELGDGEDVFLGGDGDGHVRTGSSVGDSERDVVMSGGGSDRVVSGSASGPNSDGVDLGPGDDGLEWTSNGPSPDAAIAGGAGSDTLHLQLAPGSNTVDNLAGELRHGSQTAVRWTAMEGFELSARPADLVASLDVVGSTEDEHVGVAPGVVVRAELAGGDDSFVAVQAPPDGSRIDGGPGRDRLTTGHQRQLSWDLTGSAMVVGAGRALPATGFEDAELMARRVTLSGTPGPNVLEFVASRAVVRGRGGADHLYGHRDFWYEAYRFTPATAVMTGGGGDDELTGDLGWDSRMAGGPGDDLFWSSGGDDRVSGGPGRDRARSRSGDDVFVGGSGSDRVDGGQGRDACQAEREARCEQ